MAIPVGTACSVRTQSIREGEVRDYDLKQMEVIEERSSLHFSAQLHLASGLISLTVKFADLHVGLNFFTNIARLDMFVSRQWTSIDQEVPRLSGIKIELHQ